MPRWGVLIGCAALGCVISAAACARNASDGPRPETVQATGRTTPVPPNVFTDTALYRRICVEADSGLTPASGRCTPRDQSRRPPRR